MLLAGPTGAVGLLAALVVPAFGAAAVTCPVRHFLGVVVVRLRARSRGTVPFPLLHLAPVVLTRGRGRGLAA
ncbi:hypothetical protein ACFC58_31415 [Kitasatospora purpeofusca]|uniref:hypothetical protein n=1 Tax=Kitasatospora purpeofusca TaxID=67352 RepID=UPI0035E22B29